MTTVLLHHPSFAAHQTAPGHPERPDRYRAVEMALSQPQFDTLVRETAEPADLAPTRYVHSNRYVDGLEAVRPEHGYVYLDGGDTMMEPTTWEVVPELPKTSMGKIDKKPLRARMKSAAPA